MLFSTILVMMPNQHQPTKMDTRNMQLLRSQHITRESHIWMGKYGSGVVLCKVMDNSGLFSLGQIQ
jgi:hypothetical protein